MAPAPTVLVLDGETRASLAVVRSLGRRGCRIHVASATLGSISGASRYAATSEEVPDPLKRGDHFAAAVARIASTHHAHVVLPITEASSLALLEHQSSLRGLRIPLVDLARFNRARDKAHVLETASRLGIAVPEQWQISGAAGSEADVPADGFPVVIKPVRSLAGSDSRRRKVAVHYAATASDLAATMAELGPGAGPFLIQSRVVGPGLGVFLLRWNGETVAAFAHRRLREKPPSGGESVCCESVPLPSALLTQSEALLGALDWEGVAMVEYKHDTGSGRDYLMEVNPRFWGSLQLAVDAGIDFPWYLVQLALGNEVPRPGAWRIGIRSRWHLGELDHLIARLRQSREQLHLSPDAPRLLSAAASVLLPWRPRQYGSVFRWSDPAPGVREAIGWLRAL